ncbi:MAG: TAT-variant-translocated molybdopterin oxidoreductase [Anaerolineaceae bacterium]|nr:TAT-variant-translocated molybdopterin oxidoreductase [Anaerolineaceae bacterium]
MPNQPFNWQAIRQKLDQLPEPITWRSLNELAETPEFANWVKHEFPNGTAGWQEGVSRRRFLQLMAASLGLAGLTACVGQPAETIVPYVQQPEILVPGQALHFASAHVLNGYARGIVVESHEGRPTKIEGNPEHPASLGATDVFGQAALLSLYDPDRSQTVLSDGRIRTWGEFDQLFINALEQSRARDGAGFRILTPTITSPTLMAQLTAVLNRFPQAQWHQYDPINHDAVFAGTQLAFGQPLWPRYQFEQADVIVSLDADFLFTQPGHLAYTHGYSQRRAVRQGATGMNRLYVVESSPSLTGSMADHRWPLPPAQVESFARHLAAALGLEAETAPAPSDGFARWVTAVANDLRQNTGRCLVLAGENQSPAVHALAHAMNVALGAVGQTVRYTAPLEANPGNQTNSLGQLTAAMQNSEVDLLLILDSNPVYHAPANLDFAGALAHVPLSVHMGQYNNETAVRCTWHLPQTHFLESWSDARAYDGTITIQQPLIAPLYNGRSPHELLATILGSPGQASLDVVIGRWLGEQASTAVSGPVDVGSGGEGGGSDEHDTTSDDGLTPAQNAAWQQILRLGLIPDTQAEPVDVTLSTLDLPAPSSGETDGLVLTFRPSYAVWDGRFANNAWLQETPQPFTKLTWGNAALISPLTAARLGLAAGEVVRLAVDGRSVNAPIWILPGQAEDCVTVALGYGRLEAGTVGDEVGFNAYALRTTDALWTASGLAIEQTGTTAVLANTQEHHTMEGRNLVRTAPFSTFLENPDFVHEGEGEEEGERPSLYPEFTYEGYAWGMTIDLNLCIGCNACTIACQAENNIPVVGKEGVVEGREMHWIRVDGYFKGGLENPELLHQPVPCMHCEKAPCEPVCPVAATTHSHEGLNEMTYNRCVGTRYCSNNCPYKVRRFNFYDYANDEPDLLALARNPDVTVRSRGVMEKCTYCVQRINKARINAKIENRAIQDGEIQTACQQVCPAQAIVFGDLNDITTRVSQLKAQPHNYGLLADLNTQPRTTYLARLRNLNPTLTEAADDR